MAAQSTVDREFGILVTSQDNHPKFVLSLDPVKMKRESGVCQMNLFTFLEEGLP